MFIPRQIAKSLAREKSDNSYSKIGQEMCGKDHTTVIHAHEKIMAAKSTNEDLKAHVVEHSNIQ